MAEQKQGKYTLEVPLDASGVEDFKPDQKVKVLVVRSDGGTQSVAVDLDAKGKGTARLDFDEKPGALRVIIGPPDADDEQLQGLQTISVSVSARRWADLHRLALPVVIAPYYWWWWKRWCRKFVDPRPPALPRRPAGAGRQGVRLRRGLPGGGGAAGNWSAARPPTQPARSRSSSAGAAAGGRGGGGACASGTSSPI